MLAFDYASLAPDAIFAVNVDGVVLAVTGACEKIFGYTPAEMIGKRMPDLVHPDDLARTLESIDRVMGGYQQRYFENRYIRKDGQAVRISWSASWSEQHQVRIGVARDITERSTDTGVVLARELLPDPVPCWRLSSAPRRLLAPDGIAIALSVQDHAVLLALMGRADTVTRKEIIEALGEDFLEYDQRRLDTQIRRLRRKVREASAHPLPVSTLRTVGFRFYQRALVIQ